MNDPSASLTLVGGPTALIEYGPLRFLTDPTFDPPGAYPKPGTEIVLNKLRGPALSVSEVFPVDVVLVSHDHHKDNLDLSGRAALAQAPLVLTTVDGAERLGGSARGLEVGEVAEVGDGIGVRAVRADHGPVGVAEKNGPVIGFVLDGPGLPRVYVSGDNSSTVVAEEIVAEYGPFDAAVLFVGAAQVPVAWGTETYLTLRAADAAELAGALGDALIVPIHHEGWAHFTESPDDVERVFAEAGFSGRLGLVEPGGKVSLTRA